MSKNGVYKRPIDPKAVEVGKRIRDARKAKGMTAEQLAEAVGITPQYLSKVENGTQCITILKFAKLTYGLGVSSDYLLFGSKDTRSNRINLAAEYIGGLEERERELFTGVAIHMQNVIQFLEQNNNDETH